MPMMPSLLEAKEEVEIMLSSVAARVLWLTKGAALFGGAVVTLALVLSGGTMALAAVPGDPFKLGRTNSIDQMSTLVGSASGTLLRINNNGSGPALDLRVEPGEAPMNVNSTTQVSALNADQVDGQSASAFISKDKIYSVQKTKGGPGGGADVELSADCDSGDRVLGGGGSAVFSSDLLRVSDEIGGDSWRVIAQDNGDASVVSAKAICADFPPLR